MTVYPWPSKLVGDFTMEELVAAIKASESGEYQMNPSVVQSCTREWERRHGLTPDED
ncbi:hypothetical protein [Kitasatospora sp. MBT63]|uniref:hypothetical protein n=1 Tax=Kitasatospora sp. MBT63 TaxID=1444768 RepID=UPI000AF758B0|nr:hypothetical protein [Kitasatospora sp. MBT63]